MLLLCKNKITLYDKKIKLFKNVNICSNFCAFKYDYIRVTSNKKRRKHTGINEISFINY